MICSYQFAKAKADEVQRVAWDLVVMDEAHRLRNVYKSSNIIGNALKTALAGKHKLLLTATPLQNSLLELYGLVSFIDEHAFGDLASFREQYSNLNQDTTFEHLKARLRPLCHRTLRKQVTLYIPYTKRHAIVEPFTPAENENVLYDLVSEYLQRPNLEALPSGQRGLMTLVLRKLLSSSTFAIAGALETMARRLEGKLDKKPAPESLPDELENDFETLDELREEWPTESEEPQTASQRAALQTEIAELKSFAELARSIEENTKGAALLKALATAFQTAESMGAARKAIIFTESRRTQEYLLQILAASEFGEGIVLFNGSNTDATSRCIYANWLQKNAGSDRVTSSKTADMRSALVDYFRDEGRIMIATEAGAEGINLQFCSLVVNYDLPWNPQRIEQRIGRCHRYGQKHDVVVVNFVNQCNQADQRVFELLNEKFGLFEGVFGASDEVLGAIGSGVDFEKRIAEIYQQCRKPAEIKAAFDELQRELSGELNAAMQRTQKQLLEHMDDEVREKLRMRNKDSGEMLSQFQRRLLRFSRFELNGHAQSSENVSAFELISAPFPDAPEIPLGRYELPRTSENAHIYRLAHPLAQRLIERAKKRALPAGEIVFDLTHYEGKIAVLEPLIGQSGWLRLSQLSVESLGRSEETLLASAQTDAGKALPPEDALRLFALDGEIVRELSLAQLHDAPPELQTRTLRQQNRIVEEISARNLKYFAEETDKIDAWADDRKVGLEREIKEIDRQIKEARRGATAALSLEAKLEAQKQVRVLEAQRNQKRRSLFDAQDEVDKRRETLIEEIEGKLKQNSTLQELFCVRWSLK